MKWSKCSNKTLHFNWALINDNVTDLQSDMLQMYAMVIMLLALQYSTVKDKYVEEVND